MRAGPFTAKSVAAVLSGSVVLAAAATAGPVPATPVFRIGDARITEASGIAAGRASPGVVYVQNDSGDTNRFFALDAGSGATVATVTVSGARNVDWEDIAVGPDATGRSSVWLADIGDNRADRDEVQVYRVPEPALSGTGRGERIPSAPADVWRLRYPGGAADAESLAVAADGGAYIFTKELGVSTVYRLPARPDPSRVQLLRRVAELHFAPTGTANPFGLPGQLTATGATVSADGRLLVVRTYADAYLWRVSGNDVATALRDPPVRAALPRQQQGEGVCVRGNRLLLDSEGISSPVLTVPIPALPDPAATTPAPVRSSTSAAQSSPAPTGVARGSRSDEVPLLPVVGSVVLAVLIGAWLVRRRLR